MGNKLNYPLWGGTGSLLRDDLLAVLWRELAEDLWQRLRNALEYGLEFNTQLDFQLSRHFPPAGGVTWERN